MNNSSVNIDIHARANASGLQGLNLTLVDLQRHLQQAKKDFANAAPGSEQYLTAVSAIGQLSARIEGILRPVREYAQAQANAAENGHRVNAMLTAGINPWTTASASYRAAQAALSAEAEAARRTAEEHERLNRAKQAQTRDMRADAALAAQRQMAADLREAEAATARLAAQARQLNDEHGRTPKVLAPANESTRNVGMSVLMFSQALEDAQYGIRGVLNNIPGLVLAMGGSMGLAGVISIAAVVLSQLGELLGKIDFSALTGGAEASAVAIEKLHTGTVSWAKTAVEEADRVREAMTQALEREIELIDQRYEKLLQTAKLREAEAEHAAKMAALNKPAFSDDIAHTDAWLKRETDRAEIERKGTVDKAATEVGQAGLNVQRAGDRASQVEAAAKAQEDKVAGLMEAETKMREIAQSRIKEKELEERIQALLYAPGGSVSDEQAQLAKDAQAELDKARADRTAKEQRLKSLPFLPAVEVDPKKKPEENEAAQRESNKVEMAKEKAKAEALRDKADDLAHERTKAADEHTAAVRKLQQVEEEAEAQRAAKVRDAEQTHAKAKLDRANKETKARLDQELAALDREKAETLAQSAGSAEDQKALEGEYAHRAKALKLAAEKEMQERENKMHEEEAQRATAEAKAAVARRKKINRTDGPGEKEREQTIIDEENALARAEAARERLRGGQAKLATLETKTQTEDINEATRTTPPISENPDLNQRQHQAEEWLKESIKGTNNNTARSEMSALLQSLQDGKGNEAGEVAAIERLKASVESGNGNAMSALKQAAQDMAAMSENMARTSRNLADTVRAQNTRIAELQQETAQLRDMIRNKGG